MLEALLASPDLYIFQHRPSLGVELLGTDLVEEHLRPFCPHQSGGTSLRYCTCRWNVGWLIKAGYVLQNVGWCGMQAKRGRKVKSFIRVSIRHAVMTNSFFIIFNFFL